MQLIRHWQSSASSPAPRVLAIGNFDGLHLGHQRLLQALHAAAAQTRLPAWVMSFEPHPQAHFNPERAPPRLLGVREKLQQLRSQHLAGVYLLRFAALAPLAAEAFITRILVQQLQVRHVVVGADFRFGQGRRGDVALLRQRGADAGFTVTALDMLELEGQPVSSSRIRTALAAGELALAAQLLGRPYRLEGKVGYGAQRGRLLGFPTLNVGLNRVAPLRGVYAAEVHGVADRPWPAVVNCGYRPTVDGQRYSLEAHLLDFNGDCYGLRVAVEPVAYIRAEQRFSDLAALQAQIAADVQAARCTFGSRTNEY